MSKLQLSILVLLFLTGSLLLALPPSVFASIVLGDTNVEPVTSTFHAQYVEALTKITVTQPTVVQSVSMYLQYTGSDGSQCLKFAIYADDGGAYGQSTPLNEPLIAATQNGYCFVMGDFGPAWETWILQPSDYLTIPNPGVYWLAVLPKEAYGTIYHFTYTGAYSGQGLYNYGYFMYAFPASYALGIPPTLFAAGETPGNCGNGFVMPCYPTNVGEYNAPYSFYVTGIPRTAVPEFPSAFAIVLLSCLVLATILQRSRSRRTEPPRAVSRS